MGKGRRDGNHLVSMPVHGQPRGNGSEWSNSLAKAQFRNERGRGRWLGVGRPKTREKSKPKQPAASEASGCSLATCSTHSSRALSHQQPPTAWVCRAACPIWSPNFRRGWLSQPKVLGLPEIALPPACSLPPCPLSIYPQRAVLSANHTIRTITAEASTGPL